MLQIPSELRISMPSPPERDMLQASPRRLPAHSVALDSAKKIWPIVLQSKSPPVISQAVAGRKSARVHHRGVRSCMGYGSDSNTRRCPAQARRREGEGVLEVTH